MNQSEMIDQLYIYLQEILYEPDTASLDAGMMDPTYEKLIMAMGTLLQYVREHNQYCRELENGILYTEPNVSPNNVLARPLKSVNGMLQYLVGTMQRMLEGDMGQRMLVANDISQTFNALVKQLIEQARRDSLTGLWNEDGFRCAVEELLQDGDASNQYYLIYLNVQNFKQINAVYGYERGNSELRYVAFILQRLLWPQEICARVYADHFVCFLRGRTKEDIVHRLQGLSAEQNSQSEYRHPRIRYGCYSVENPHMPVQKMIELARFACERVSRNGEINHGIFNEGMAKQYLQQNVLLHAFPQTLRKNSFIISYELQVDQNTELAVGCEAIVYWLNPQRENMLYADFAPLLEHYGLSMQFDLYVLQQVCQFLRKNIDREVPITPITICVSRQTLLETTCVSRMKEVLQSFWLEPKWLILRVRDMGTISDVGSIKRNLQELHDAGFRLAIQAEDLQIDRIEFLQAVPREFLLLDLAATDQKGLDGISQALLQGQLSAAQELGLTPIATGVASATTVAFLLQHQCSCIQGPYAHVPLNAHELEAFLKHNGNGIRQGSAVEGDVV